MSRIARVRILWIMTIVCAIIMLLTKRLSQDPSYHQFADHSTIAGIPNFGNVLSNFLFLVVGLYGLLLIKRSHAATSVNAMYTILFTGIFLTGMGSAYYHLAPDNASLVFDRIPMTIVFMSFLSATIAAWIDSKAGVRILIPLLLLGVFSVLWWHHTEQIGAGDLRLYGFIQFYPMLIMPVIFLLFASSENNKGLHLLIWVIGWYVAAKLFETFDLYIYEHTGFISGHSLKHLAAAVATWYIVQFFKKKYVVSTQQAQIPMMRAHNPDL